MGMYRYTANYLRTNSNFVIQNLKKCSVENGYKPEICVLKNILQRGCPTKMSRYLVSQIGEVNLDKEAIKLIDIEMPKWINAIKGDATHNYFPARVFYEELIPKHLSEFKFIQQLMLPEALINEITEVENEMFVDQRVDFYLPQAKLIIEIDGQQHKKNDVNRVNNRLRDCYLRKYGFKTIRIETNDLRDENEIFIIRIREIQNRLNTYHNETEPLIGFYSEKGILRTVKGQDTIEKTTSLTRAALGL
jgi:ATP-dependent DNA helicase RecQ